MQSQSGLIKEVKTEIEDVAPDIIQGGTDEGPHTTVVQETNVSPSIQEGRTTDCRVISTVGSTAENSPNELVLKFGVDITIEKAFFQVEVRMSAENNEIPPPPVIPRPLARISPRRHSSRKRDSPDFFVPTPFSPSPRLHGEGLRRGPGRPPKQRSDESSASQPLRRGPGRPQRKRSDGPTNAPEVVLSPPVPPTGSNGNIPELVPPPPVPPLGSISDTPLQIPCDEEDDQRETKLKLNPLSRLETPKQTHSSQSQMPEKSKKVVTDEVQSVLVSHLTSGTTTSVDDMVNFANSAFSTLNWIGADYGSFYEDVKNMISYKYDLFIAERDGNMCSVSELEKQGLDAALRVYNIEKEIENTQAKQEKDKVKKEHLMIQIEASRKMLLELELEVANIEQDEKCTKDDEQKHRAAHRIAQAEVKKFSTQAEAARVVQRDIEQRKNEALQGIESTTQRLLSSVKEREK